MVDDDLTIRSLLKEALSLEGYRIRTVANGSDALKILQQFPNCNLLLLDLVMPGWNGEQTLEQLRNYSPDLPAVIMTGHDKDGCLPALKQLGINGFIEKPFLISEILQITCQFLTSPPPIVQQG
ncbi:MAG: response regulator [Immundisolibacteraceae bacterium]|nr:response regulator [Immundisolibacteraceae bacterium]